MGRYRPCSSHDHKIKRKRDDEFVLSWRVDFHYRDSRLRHPRWFSRDTNRKGAERFAKKWGVVMPPETK